MIERYGNFILVKVGSVDYLMRETHWIEWIVLETITGYQKDLKPGDEPIAFFALTEPVVAAYEC